MYLVVGDWSSDGHGKSEKVLLQSNVDVVSIQQAYKDSCKLTGVSFNINEDYTGLNRHYKEADEYQIATQYGRSGIPAKALLALLNHGFRENFLNKWEFPELDEAMKEGTDLYYDDLFPELWIWFVKLSLPQDTIIEKCEVKDEIPKINGYWNKNLNVGFGYGLFE